MSKEFKLKLCPFCGTQPVMEEKGSDLTSKRSVTVRCPHCRIQRTDAAIRYGMDWLRNAATEDWNNQPHLDDSFAAGRALGRREMKGECKTVAATACEGFATPIYDYGKGILECRAKTVSAIEAIPEEG